MKKHDFIDIMNSAGDEVHYRDGKADTCYAVVTSKLREAYQNMLLETFKEFDGDSSLNMTLLKKRWKHLNKSERKAAYQLRILCLAVFTAWALKTRAYRKW